MRFLKKLLIRIIIAAILFLAKEYINLDNDLVNSLIIIIISTFLLDFNTFSLEKRIDMDRRIRDFEDLKNQSESDESMIPVLADIKCKLDEDIEALNEYTNVINDETRASNAEVGKLLLDNEKKRAALRLKKGISESESDSE